MGEIRDLPVFRGSMDVLISEMRRRRAVMVWLWAGRRLMNLIWGLGLGLMDEMMRTKRHEASALV